MPPSTRDHWDIPLCHGNEHLRKCPETVLTSQYRSPPRVIHAAVRNRPHCCPSPHGGTDTRIDSSNPVILATNAAVVDANAGDVGHIVMIS